MKNTQDRSIKELTYKAKSGDLKAAFQLYKNYRDGSFVEVDKARAEDYASMAINLFREQSLRISKLNLTGFRAFKSVELDFGSENLSVLVGINGSGKTSILDAIAYCLSWLILRITKPENSGSGWGLKESDIYSNESVMLEYASVVLDLGLNPSAHYEMELSKSKTGSNRLRKGVLEEIGQLGALYKLANEKHNDFNMPILAYYGVSRTLEGFSKKDINKILGDLGDKEDKFDAYDLKALDARVNFVEFFKWFKFQQEIVEFETGEPQKRAQLSLSQVSKAITDVIPILSNLRIQRVPYLDMLVDKGSFSLSVGQLSQGEKSLLALVFDITRRLILLNPEIESRSPLEGAGVILIDEIDLHLHPDWQQSIVPNLLKVFPNIQFILTTHSPQVLTTVPSKSIFLLNNGEVFGAPTGTKGAESSRILKRVFDVDPRPPKDENTQLLKNYLDKVYDDRWEEESVVKMRVKLDAIFGTEEPELTRADLYIENRKWEIGFEEDQ